ncbi:MAG: M48 family metalloprotease [Chroococcidiopsidaceae cyanobacterium CP_BM_ER_R8_30]|nr:M48 family metalloprotease [Chroococcidiopsidaceae cyanobacterium CP_BM_ER_R8_30]
MASVPYSSLKIGLTALKQEDYQTAITHLETVCRNPSLPLHSLTKVQMGLVVAYHKTGTIGCAIALCQKLAKSTDPKVKNWADKIYADLTEQTERGDRNPSTPPLPKWRQAGRASQWQPLCGVNLIPFWLLQVGTAVVLFWVICELVKLGLFFTNSLLAYLPLLEPIQLLYKDPTQILLLTLSIAFCLSPWLLDGLLRLFYDCQPLSSDRLSQHSPEMVQMLQNYCLKRHWPLPRLGILPTNIPLVLTYGNLPCTARIVVSQGLLAQLEDDEIAAICASQLGQITYWDFVVISLGVLVIQIPYIVYWQVSLWGDRRSSQILRNGAAIIASLGYGLYYLLRSPVVWLSRLRVYYSDRFAADLTGNPNGLSRAILKITIGIAQEIQQQGYTLWLLESFNLLSPVDHQQAISLGSLPPDTQFESVLTWDCLNPNRHWLGFNNTHPLLGERLQRLTHIAYYWQLPTELDLVELETVASALNSKSLLQAAPFLGILLSFASGAIFWLLWKLGFVLGFWSLSWIYDDWSLFRGLVPIGFSLGTLVRINTLFPDIKPTNVQTNIKLQDLLASSTALPIDGQPIRLQGKLLGRRGISNWLGQDLLLDSTTGLVKLHHTSWLGLGYLLPRSPRPYDLIGRSITVTGWFRRGTRAWIDIDMLRTYNGATSRSSHPLWSTVLASAAAIGGAYILWKGG